jgi:hypothetical protein
MQMPLEADLQRRCRELQLRYHPDKNGDGSGDMASLLNQARCLFLSVHLCPSHRDFVLSVVGSFFLSHHLSLSIFPILSLSPSCVLSLSLALSLHVPVHVSVFVIVFVFVSVSDL